MCIYTVYCVDSDFVCKDANIRSQRFTLGTTNVFLTHQTDLLIWSKDISITENPEQTATNNWSYVRIRPRTNLC